MTIAHYNDLIRQSLINPAIKQQLANEGCRHQVSITASASHAIKNQYGLLQALAAVNHFEEGNDPYGEHDFICFSYEGHELIAKFDYFDSNMEYGSENPEDLESTIRLLMIMLASDY